MSMLFFYKGILIKVIGEVRYFREFLICEDNYCFLKVFVVFCVFVIDWFREYVVFFLFL